MSPGTYAKTNSHPGEGSFVFPARERFHQQEQDAEGQNEYFESDRRDHNVSRNVAAFTLGVMNARNTRGKKPAKRSVAIKSEIGQRSEN